MNNLGCNEALYITLSATFAFLNFWYHIGRLFLPQLTWRRATQQKVVYLTFDDGPHPTITPWVISTLKMANAKGTFFVVGQNAQKYKQVLHQLKAGGHGIANHTHHHTKGWGRSAIEYQKDVADCDAEIGTQRLFRPPFGRINFKSISAIKEHKEIIMWDILTKDYLQTLNTKKAQKRIQRATVPGSIVVFHDSEKAEKQLKILLPEYIQFLQKEGFKMEVL